MVFWNLDYVEDVYQTMLSNVNSDVLQNTIQELKDMTPLPMNIMLKKENKKDAIEKHKRRKTMTVRDVRTLYHAWYVMYDSGF